MIGDVRLADVLVAPSPEVGNAVFRLGGWSPAAGFWAAEREMKVSTHFAKEYVTLAQSSGRFQTVNE